MPEATTVATPPKGAVQTNGKPADTATEIKPAENGAAKPAEATRTIKVNGKEVQVTESQLITLAQKGYFADQSLKSTRELTAKTQRLIEALKSPEGILEVIKDPTLGISTDDLLERILASDMSDERKERLSKFVYENVVLASKKTPEELEKDKKLGDYERLKKQEEARKKAEADQQQKQQLDQVYKAVRAEVVKAVKDDKSFPQVEGSMRAVMQKLKVMNANNVPINETSIKKAVDLVKKDILLHQQAIFDAITDDEALVATFGEERALRFSRALVARLKAKAKSEAEKPKPEQENRLKVTDAIDKKLGRERHGYQVLDV